MRTSKPLMTVEKPDSAEPNHHRRMKKTGLRCKFLNRSLQGGGFSTWPLKYLVSSGSNHKVSYIVGEEQYYCQSYIFLTLMIRFDNTSLYVR